MIRSARTHARLGPFRAAGRRLILAMSRATSSILFLTMVAVILDGSSDAAKLPSSFKRCERRDRNLDGCLQDALEKVIMVLKNGVPSLSIPKMDPLQITQLAVSSSPSGPVSLDLKLNNVKVFNIFELTTKMHDAKFNLDAYQGRAWASIPELIVEAEYEMIGRVLLLPLSGKGPFKISLKEAEILFDIQFEPKTRADNKTYGIVKDFKIDLISPRKKVQLDNLVSKEKAISDSMNVFINENLDAVYSELKPAIDEGLAAAFTVYTNKIFGKVPFNEIFPEKL